MTGLWGGRFSGQPDPLFLRFNCSLPVDQRLWAEDLAGSEVWARALFEAQVLTESETDELVAALLGLAAELAEDPAPLAGSDAEDVHTFVELELTRRLGDLARKLHTGRSRNDQVATDLKLYLKRTVPDLQAGLVDLISALVDLAARNHDLPMPGFTHLQRAQPVTAGHHALAYVEMLSRDLERVRDCLSRMDSSPLGSGALAGTTARVDRARLARQLGFERGPTRNSLDGVSARDHLCELVFDCAMIMVHLSRLAEDWIFFASSEAGLLTFDDAVTTGSSLMPQKKNPDLMELLRGKTARVIGDLNGLLILLKGLPLAYNKDLQEDKQGLFDALDTTGLCLRVAATAARNAQYQPERCRAASARGYLNATDLADLLVQQGVAFRDAHERVGALVLRAIELGVELEELPEPVKHEWAPELDRDAWAELTVAKVLERRDRVGGTAPARVADEVQRWREWLQARSSDQSLAGTE